MIYLRTALVCALIFMSNTESVSGQPSSSPCDGVLIAANDVSIKVSSKQWDTYLLHKHCRKQGDKWHFDHEGDVGLPSPAPRIFGTWTYDQDRVQDFCKRKEERRVGGEAEADYVSQVVQRSVLAWETCQRMQTQGIHLVPTTTADHVHVAVSRSRDDSTLQSLVFDGFVECVVSDDAGVKKHTASPVSLKSVLKTPSQTNIDCARKKKLENGKTKMPQARLTVNAGRGALILDYPDEELYSVGSSVAEAMAEQEAALARVLGLGTRKNVPLSEIWSHEGNEWGSWHGESYCPIGQYVCGVKVKFEECCHKDDTGLNAVKLKCCPFFPKPAEGDK